MFRRATQQTRGKRSEGFNGTDAASLALELQEWTSAQRPLLGELLLDGAINAEQLTAALRFQKEHGGRLGQILEQHAGMHEHQLAEALSMQFEIPLADLLHEEPDPTAVDLVDRDMALRHNVVPLRVVGDRVQVVISDPLDTEAIRELTEHCKRIALLVGTPTEISRTIDTVYDELRDAQVAIKAFELADEPTDGSDGESTIGGVDENAPVVQVVNRILAQGVRSRASDIHIEPTMNDVRVRFRVDGAMTEAIRLPARMASPLVSRIKVLAELNIVERRRPQDGQFSATVDGRPIDVRTSVVATVHGEKIVLRILDKTRSLISLNELGMPAEVVAPYLKIVKAPLGMLLCTGPTGSGKTTTLYATLAQVNAPTKNVVTIEDPVEYQFDGVNQMQVSDTSGITFADGLRGILRQDPDVILLGEIRDIETASIAMQAALTGHFVLSSLHAVDSVAALHRFTDMGLEPFLVASAVNGVIGQRLLRRICDSCKQPFRAPADQVRLVASQLGNGSATFAKGEGCNLCNNTGYRGRIGVYELLSVSDKIRELIVDKATHTVMRKVAVQEGMRTMQYEAFQLVANGVTTVEEVIRSVYAPGVDLEAAPLGELLPGKKALHAAPQLDGDDDEHTSPVPLGPVADGTVDLTDGARTSNIWEVGA